MPARLLLLRNVVNLMKYFKNVGQSSSDPLTFRFSPTSATFTDYWERSISILEGLEQAKKMVADISFSNSNGVIL